MGSDPGKTIESMNGNQGGKARSAATVLIGKVKDPDKKKKYRKGPPNNREGAKGADNGSRVTFGKKWCLEKKVTQSSVYEKGSKSKV